MSRRAFDGENAGGSYYSGSSITMPVRKGDYWKVEAPWGSSYVYWIPLGD
jgi:hypothetical protein